GTGQRSGGTHAWTPARDRSAGRREHEEGGRGVDAVGDLERGVRWRDVEDVPGGQCAAGVSRRRDADHEGLRLADRIVERRHAGATVRDPVGAASRHRDTYRIDEVRIEKPRISW